MDDRLIEIGLEAADPGWNQGPESQALTLIQEAFDASKSVPYKVSLRWIFYRLWQQGTLAHVPATPRMSKKENAYVRLKSTCSKAVHYGALDPDWVADETRREGGRSGYSSAANWIESLKYLECYIDYWWNQPYYVMIAFEAEAMVQQFNYYTSDYGCRLWPMKGDPSNPYKLKIAETVDYVSRLFAVSVIILYFGDLDVKGQSIPEAAFRDVHQWCRDADLTVYRVGLNPGDEVEFDLPDIPGKPGAYQWEALQDDQAAELILNALREFLDEDILEEVKVKEKETTDLVQEMLENLLEDYGE